MIRAVLFFGIVLFGISFVGISYQTHVSEPMISLEKTEYLKGQAITLEGWVNYSGEPTSDVLLHILAKNNHGGQMFDEYITSASDGTFSIEIPIPNDAQYGKYTIEVISQCREIHRDICTHQSKSFEITISEGIDRKIPEWVKNVFLWYGQEKVSEDELLDAIKFLIKENIIKIEY